VSDVELVVVDSVAEAVEATATRIAEAVAAGGQIALSGGSSPRPAYERVAVLRPDWSGVELWWVDERVVPPADDRSNYRLVRESLLDGLARLPRAVHRVRGELEPDAAAAAYDAELEGVTVDFALMGIGGDGHTASLFPSADALSVEDRRAIAAPAGLEPFVPRVTMTRPLLAGVGTMVYLALGAGKAEAVERAFAQPPSPETPASLVRGRQTIAILDRPAAARLTFS
jgi:6-phosphogluconolactonase